MNTKSSGSTQDNTGYCGFVVGQRVVLTDDHFFPKNGGRRYWERKGVRFPVLGTGYTVRAVFISARGGAALHLAEIRNPIVTSDHKEAYFLARRFRPLKKLKVEDFMSAPVDGERVSA